MLRSTLFAIAFLVSACGGLTPQKAELPQCQPASGAVNQLDKCDEGLCNFGGEPGHYAISMVFDSPFEGRISAESRRVLYSPTIAGTAKTCVQFIANVRTPEGQPIQESAPLGNPGLQLKFDGNNAALQAVYVEKLAAPTKLLIAGDSTVCDQDPQLDKPANERFSGWGQFIGAYMNADISVSNYADSGEGSFAFRPDGGVLWGLLESELAANDWVLIQLGHNDKTTPAVVYRQRMEDMLQKIKAAGATPVLVTPMIRNNKEPLTGQHIWPELNVRNELLALAKQESVAIIDLMALTDAWARELGQSEAQTYFVKRDRTHSNEQGAALFAAMIIEQIKKQSIGLGEYLRK